MTPRPIAIVLALFVAAAPLPCRADPAADPAAAATPAPALDVARQNLAIDRYNRGIDRAAANDFAGAVALYREALKHDPDMAAAWNNLGIALLRLGEPAAAVEALMRGVALSTDAPGEPLLNLAVAYRSAGRVDEAIATAERILQMPSPPEELPPRALLLLGSLHYGRDEFAKAATLFEDLVARRPQDAFAWFNLAMARFRLDRFETSEEAFAKAVDLDEKLDRSQPLLHYCRGIMARARGDTKASRKFLQRAVELSDTPEYRAELVTAWLDEGDAAKAEQELARLDLPGTGTAAPPTPALLAALHLRLAEALSDADKFEPAVTHYLRASELDPGSEVKPGLNEKLSRNIAAAFLFRAEVLRGKKDYPAALSDYEKSLSYASLPKALEGIARTYLALARFTDAIDAFDRLRAAGGAPDEPALATARVGRARELLKDLRAPVHCGLPAAAGSPDALTQADADLQAAVQALPPNLQPEACFLQGLARCGLGQLGAALEQFDCAARSSPGHDAAWFNAGLCALALGDLAGARERLANVSPDHLDGALTGAYQRARLLTAAGSGAPAELVTPPGAASSDTTAVEPELLAAVWTRNATALLESGTATDALRAYEQALAYQPALSEAKIGRVLARWRELDSGQLLAALSTHLAENESNPAVQFLVRVNRARLHRRLGRPADELADLDAARRLAAQRAGDLSGACGKQELSVCLQEIADRIDTVHRIWGLSP
ncbi:MAG: tetratricopeptide repeat protein [Candidatus Schekmanbacteria bacterium]|nr:tetratricopeptide repeat protein [Candidatus Schekmanbacteria bacterium]